MKKLAVQITLLSQQQDEGDVQVTSQTHEGTFYLREGMGSYLTYTDQGTNTTMRFEADEVRLYRRGEVSSWQVFNPHKDTGGLLTLGVNEMVLHVVTKHLAVHYDEHGGRVQLAYVLFGEESRPEPGQPVVEIPMGEFSLSIAWKTV